MRYGREMEPIAVQKYKSETGYSVIKTGIFIKPCQPWLAASPDGIVKTPEGELYVLEVKCPVSCRNTTIRVPYLTEEGILNVKHKYYTQVQIQLYCCNLDAAHFFCILRKRLLSY